MILKINGLSFKYRTHRVLSNIQFEVKKNEVLAIMGPNGVGKTTLLRCINSLHKPFCGTIFLEENNILKMSRIEIARKIGYVAQRNETARLTAFDAILLGRHPYITWKITERDLKIVNSIIKKLHLSDLSLRYIDQMSGGELQKVCMARALVQEPELLLLDEPTSNLDLKNKIEILRLIRGVVKGHDVSCIMTMHDINMAVHYADRFLFLKNNKVFAVCGKKDITAEIIEKVYNVKVNLQEYKGYPVILPYEY